VSEPDTSRTATSARVSRELSSFRLISAFYIPPRSPAIPYLAPSRSRRVEFRQDRRRDPYRNQSAVAAHPKHREQLAELRFRFTKSPEFSFRYFELSVFP
jgi:hypothetical protein